MTTQQEELLLQAAIIGHVNDPKKGPLGLRGQGFYAEKQSERFKAGRPDLRIGRDDLGQLDAELKICYEDVTWGAGTKEIDLGFTKLQWLHLKTMNEHGIPALGLVYFPKREVFLLTVDMVLCPSLSGPPRVCSKLPAPQIIDGVQLFKAAKELLLYDRGYKHFWRS